MRIFEPYHMPCQIGLSKPQVFQYCYCLDAHTHSRPTALPGQLMWFVKIKELKKLAQFDAVGAIVK